MIKKPSHCRKWRRYALFGISVIFLIYVIQYYLLWYQPLFCPEYERPFHPHQRWPNEEFDLHGNMLVVDAKDNMVVVIAWPFEFFKKHGITGWMPRYGWTRNSTDFYTSAGRNHVKVYRSPNTFVVIDGWTGKYLLKEPIAENEAQRWYTQLTKRDDLCENILKLSCKEFRLC